MPKTILTTLKSQGFSITKTNEHTYKTLFTSYKEYFIGDNLSTLFANISYLLTNRFLIDHLLSYLEADVKALWELDENLKTSKPSEYVTGSYKKLFGLLWPVPIQTLANIHTNHLLSKALLALEQAHGINLANDDPSAPIPTFVGVVSDLVAKSVLDKAQLWNEDPRLSALFYHGKMSHRIQFYLIMKAVDLKLLDLGATTIQQLIHYLTDVKLKGALAWDRVVDNIVTNYNLIAINRSYSNPLFNVISEQPPKIDSLSNHQPIIYACDPYYLQSYLMTVSKEKTPYLSTCITKMFNKSAFDIQKLEKSINSISHLKDYALKHTDQFNYGIESRQPTDDDLKIENILEQQAFTFSLGEAQTIKSTHIFDEQKRKGKVLANNHNIKSSNEGAVQYRSFFSSPPSTPKDQDSNKQPGSVTKKQKIK